MSGHKASSTGEPIAIIGSGCRFPGSVNTPSQLWELLKEPKDLLTKIPKDKFDVDAFYHPDGSYPGRGNATHAYMLKQDTRAFDSSFFGIQPREAEAIDPQQRLLLETVYDSLCSAGLKMEDLQGSSTAVYVGCMTHDFVDGINLDLDTAPTYTATGSGMSILSNRVSYFFDWHGPSETIDTACSSSLVAVHNAIQQLRNGSSKIAIASGSNLILGPWLYVVLSKLGMLSPTGRSRMWDASADGYARGEGVASIVLKTLSQALADGDRIECIIRETGVNQDGRTAGITMPSAKAQKMLIREVYNRAGLDLSDPKQRCQYFEAHGTGTPAGDPQEAEAISSAFFGDRGGASEIDEVPLYVGSIKTVIGHTEGTAGIAGLLKASLAIQHGVIPPNMLFEELSPRVAPFYTNLKIVSHAQPWPELAPGVPRRASVNSFGFGGTNAHAIVEQFQGTSESEPRPHDKSTSLSLPIAPMVLSASTEHALTTCIDHLLQWLESNREVQMRDLVSTLWTKRSALPARRAIAAQTTSAAINALQRELAAPGPKEGALLSSDLKDETPALLGVFTGQGAQWPAMGKVLLSTVPFARDVMTQLDRSLQTLPSQYRPTWCLEEQLCLEAGTSNVGDAVFSQPLCCAVQIMLVQLLAAAGIQFKAVVGHSSGEIACAYAAGFITAEQAIRIAYLRGFVSTLAASPSGSGVPGAMLAAGTTYDDARELCDLVTSDGSSIRVAAINSAESVTLSGDADAIQTAQTALEDESKFARLLKVDKAYHSHHMLPCSAPYIQALRESGCAAIAGSNPNPHPPSSSIWISSVYEGKRMAQADVTAEYFSANLVSPVLFGPAVETVVFEYAPFHVAIEIGPHPALRGPCLDTIERCAGKKIPYFGCMQRGTDDLDAFSRALGSLYEVFGSRIVDIEGLNEQLSPDTPLQSLAKELPPYAWDHARSYGHQSRIARAYLRGTAGQPPHLLLGKMSPNSTAAHLEWHKYLRLRDMPWIEGHKLQGRIVFPGAGYIVMAMEAAMHVAGDREVQLLEVLNLTMDKALSFDDGDSVIEVNTTVWVVATPLDPYHITLDFCIASCLAKERDLSPSAKGQAVITLGPASPLALPAPDPEPPHTNKVSIDSLYQAIGDLGYGYTNEFRGITSMRRADRRAHGALALRRLQDGGHTLLLHPATLDLAFQTFFGANSAPGEKYLRSLVIPTSIGRVALNPWLAQRANSNSAIEELGYHSSAVGDPIHMFTLEDRATVCQIEDIAFRPIAPASSKDDHEVFAKWVWGPLAPTCDPAKYLVTEQDEAYAGMVERITYFYVRTFLATLSGEDRDHAEFHLQCYIHWCEEVVRGAKDGQHPWYEASWESDTNEAIHQIIEDKAGNSPDSRLIRRVGENLSRIIHENENPFALMDHDGLLTEYYRVALGFGPLQLACKDIVGQIMHRHQHMDILEVGGGTGGATKFILGLDQFSCKSYTFTDVSTAFFEHAQQEFARHEERMLFRALDISADPTIQGFHEHSYDLIVASNVLHATPKLEETMLNVRRLLKPGGQLVISEITQGQLQTRGSVIFGLFPDWWASVDGRSQPFVTMEAWDALLRNTGFSGIECRIPYRDDRVAVCSTFSAHAVDEPTNQILEPLVFPPTEPFPPLVVVGGASERSANILHELKALLPNRPVSVARRIQDIGESEYQPLSTFVILSELDEELFSNLTREKFEALKSLFFYARNLLWLTEDAWCEHPYQATTIGFLRSIRAEYPDSNIQVVNVDTVANLEPKVLVEQLLRLENSGLAHEAGVVWTTEPEIYLSKNNTLVPRLKPDVPRNHRLNSIRRSIMTEVNPETRPVSISHNGEEMYLELGDDYEPCHATTSVLVHIRVRHALLQAVRIRGSGYFYVVQGVDARSNKPVVALSERNASLIAVPSSHVVASPTAQNLDASDLLSIAAQLMAQTILYDTVHGASVVVIEPPRFAAGAIERRAVESGVLLRYLSTKVESSSDTGPWFPVHVRDSSAILKSLLPANLSALYDFSLHDGVSSLGQRLRKCLPRSCVLYRGEHLIQGSASPINTTGKQITKALAEAVERAGLADAVLDTTVVPASTLIAVSKGLREDISTVVNWMADQRLSARIRPIDGGNIFASNKTYVLVGLTGDLGRSICRYMISHGARHIVLSSRNPNLDKRWLESMMKLGGNMMVLPMDVVKEASVDAGLAKIRASMPPLGGVAFGPLVLQDSLFKHMDVEMMHMVLEPKVTGVRLLHERLADICPPLDFFVMFSSFHMVCGNYGQSAYSAANAYKHGIVQQRRKAGLAGSTINIGALMSLGYIVKAAREEITLDDIGVKFEVVAEPELHSLFAEAVVCGRPNSGIEDVELTTGMVYLDPAYREMVHFFDDPRFGYYKRAGQDSNAGKITSSAVSVKESLKLAVTMEEVRQIITDGLVQKLRVALQMGTENIQSLLTVPLIDQGVDSRSAITIGNWFTTNLDLELPPLRILGGASVTDLVEEATGQLPPEAIPAIESKSAVSVPSAGYDLPISDSHYDSGTLTPPSSFEAESKDQEDKSEVFFMLRKEPISLSQSHNWILHHQARDSKTLNATIGIYLQGFIDPTTLAKSVDRSLQRHEIFRTRFIDGDDVSTTPVQATMSSPVVRLESIAVADRSAAEQGLRDLENHHYDIAAGETMRIVHLYWNLDNHLLAFGYTRLAFDRLTVEKLFVEISKLYDGISLPRALQYADAGLQQRLAHGIGAMEPHLSYWKSLYPTLPTTLPIMRLPQAQPRGPVSIAEHTLTVRLDAMNALRIGSLSRIHKLPNMPFYLVAYYVLLARLSESTDISIGVTDVNRPSPDDSSTMGDFSNLLPLRFAYSTRDTFVEALAAAKEALSSASQHASVPYHLILERLGVDAQKYDTHAPLFQAVFDYKQGSMETAGIGKSKVVETTPTRVRTPYDVTLEVWEDGTNRPLLTFKLQSSLYGEDDLKVLMNSYLITLSVFSRNPALRVEEGKLDPAVERC
ncbi:hypothetical protein WAI453_003044 [Rhynchosporium graminicola]